MPETRQKLADALGIESDQLLSPPPVTVDREQRTWIRCAMALQDGTSIQHAVVYTAEGELRAMVTETPEDPEQLAQDFRRRGNAPGQWCSRAMVTMFPVRSGAIKGHEQ